MFCKNCGTEINGTVRFCPGCGVKVEQKPDSLVCPACGVPVRAGAKFCKECGAKVEQKSDSLVCPACGAPVKAGVKFCKECGAKVEQKSDSLVCPACGAPVKAGAKFCKECGAKVEQKPDSLVCPACGAPVKAGVKFCKECGAALSGGRPEVFPPMSPVMSDPNRPVCPYCGMQLVSLVDHCLDCGLQAVTMQEYLDSWVCPECSEVLSKGDTCPYCGKKAVLRRSMHTQSGRVAAGGTPPVATITEDDQVTVPMQKTEVDHQQMIRGTSDRLKQQAGTAARQVAKTALQKIMEIETQASGLPGETRIPLNSEQMSVLSNVARSLIKRR